MFTPHRCLAKACLWVNKISILSERYCLLKCCQLALVLGLKRGKNHQIAEVRFHICSPFIFRLMHLGFVDFEAVGRIAYGIATSEIAWEGGSSGFWLGTVT